ncbi:MAG: phage tail tape measure protein [Victivallales bacterium]|nr:phage tail tape measure protein [Victivallales bacterium]
MPDYSNITAGTAVVNLVGNSEELLRALNRASTSLAGFTTVCSEVGTRLQAIGNIITEPFANAARTFAEFDKQMRTVRAVTNSSGADFTKLTEKAKELGATTSFTASQVAEGMTALGRMGFNSSEIDGAIQGMLNLSIATGTDLAQASEIAANNMRVFGMNTSQMTEIADLLAFTANGSAQTLEDLGEALKTAGPIAARAGVSLKDTAAQLGVLANMGIRGSMAGTAIARSYKRLADPTIQKFIKETLNVDVLDATGNLRDMATVFAEIGKEIARIPSNAQRLSIMEDIFEARGSLGGGTLSINTEAMDEFLEKMKDLKGYSTEAAGGISSGMKGALDGMSSAFESVRIAIGDALDAPLTELINKIANVARAFTDFISNNKSLVVFVASAAGAIAVLGTGLAMLAGVLGTVNTFNRAFGALMPFLTQGILAQAAATYQATAALSWHTVIGRAAVRIRTLYRAIESACTMVTRRATIANLAHAVSVGVVTAATHAWATATGFLKVALTALSAHPIIAALTAIAAIGVAIAMHFHNAAKAADKLKYSIASVEDSHRKEKRSLADTANERDERSILRLRELSAKSGSQKLTEEEQAEAEELLGGLSKRGYGNLPTLYKSNGTLGEFTDEMKEAAVKVATENRRKAIVQEIVDVDNELNTVNRSLTTANDPTSKEYTALLQQQKDLIERRRALNSEMKNITTEINRKETEKAEANLLELRKQNMEAAEKSAEIEKKLADQKKSTIQKEIEEIELEKKAYMEALQAQLAYEKANPRKDQSRIDELEAKLEEAEALFQEVKEEALSKHYKNEGLLDVDTDLAKREDERLQNSQKTAFEQGLEALKNNPDEYMGFLHDALDGLANAISEAADNYKAALEEAQSAMSENGAEISPAEKERLDKLKAIYQAAQGRQDRIQALMDQVQSGAEEARKETSDISSFNAAAVTQMVIGLSSSDAAEETRKNTAKANDLLQSILDVSKENSWSL